MEKADVVKIGDEKLLRLPKDFNSNDDEILIRKIGKMLMIVPKNDVLDTFVEGLNGFTEDFFPNGREKQTLN